MADVIDLIQSPEIYDCFDGNSAEVDVMIDYMRMQRLTPKQIYRQVSIFTSRVLYKISLT